jgi:hypothetical protein
MDHYIRNQNQDILSYYKYIWSTIKNKYKGKTIINNAEPHFKSIDQQILRCGIKNLPYYLVQFKHREEAICFAYIKLLEFQTYTKKKEIDDYTLNVIATLSNTHKVRFSKDIEKSTEMLSQAIKDLDAELALMTSNDLKALCYYLHAESLCYHAQYGLGPVSLDDCIVPDFCTYSPDRYLNALHYIEKCLNIEQNNQFKDKCYILKNKIDTYLSNYSVNCFKKQYRKDSKQAFSTLKSHINSKYIKVRVYKNNKFQDEINSHNTQTINKYLGQ